MNNEYIKKIISLLIILSMILSSIHCVFANTQYIYGYIEVSINNESKNYVVINNNNELYMQAEDISEITGYDLDIHDFIAFCKSGGYENCTAVSIDFDGTTSAMGNTYELNIIKQDDYFYLPLNEMLYLLHAQWCMEEGKVMIQPLQYTILDFIVENHSNIILNKVNQTDLLINGESELAHNIRTSLAVMFNNFDPKLFVIYWPGEGWVPALNKVYEEAILQLNIDDMDFLDSYGQTQITSELEKIDLSSIQSSLSSIKDTIDVSENIAEIIKQIEDLSNTNKSLKFDLYYDFALLTPPQIQALSKELGEITDALKIINIALKFNEVYQRSENWDEDFINQISILTDFDGTQYKASVFNSIKNVATNLINECNDPFMAATDEALQQTAALLLDSLFGQTIFGKYFAIFNMELSMYKTFYPNIKNSMDAAELAYMVDALIKIEQIAVGEMNTEYENILDINFDGEFSEEHLKRLRNSVMLSLRTNLRNHAFIYYLNEKLNDDTNWENSQQAMDIRNNIIEDYILICKLMETEKYDRLLFLNNFENMYSDEFGKMRQQITTEVFHEGEIPELEVVDTTQTYIDFLKAQEYESYISDWIYGDPTHYAILDIDDDGIDELIITGGDGTGFYNFTVFSYDRKSKEVYPIPNVYSDVIGNEKEGYFFQNYGGLRYSPSHKALVFSELRTGSMYGGLSYFTIKNQELVSDFGIWHEYDYQSNKTTYGYSESGNRIAVDEDEYQEYLNELNESSDPEFQPIPKEGATEVSIEEYFGGDFDKKLISIRPLYDSAANAVIKIGDYNNSPDENVTWSVIYSVLNTFSERTQTSESVKHELGSAIKVNTNELVDLHNEIFANKITSLPALGSYYTDNEYSGISYSEEEDVYYFINATGGGYFGEFKDGYVLENGNAVLEFSVENIVVEHMGDCRIEITPDSGSRFGYTIVSAVKI